MNKLLCFHFTIIKYLTVSFNSNIKIENDSSTNKLLISNKKNYIEIRYIDLYLNKVFIKNNNYLFTTIVYFKILLRKLSNIILGIVYNWFLYLEMQGLGFRIFYNRNEELLRLKVGYSHYIMIPLSKSNINIRTKRKLGKTQIFIYSSDKDFLIKISSIITTYRKFNIYKLKGLYKKNNYLNILKKSKKKSII